MGDLKAVELQNGEIIWESQFQHEFDAELPTWGFCGSPLLVEHEGKQLVVVQPGGSIGSLVAFDLEDGSIAWSSTGGKPSYSSFIYSTINGNGQIIGYDEKTLGGWDSSGNKLWTLKPEFEGDFNVPTPIVIDNCLFVTTENNSSRIYEFDSDGIPNKVPSFTNKNLSPDTHTPVRCGEFICGIQQSLFVLRSKDLSVVHELADSSFYEYASIISDGREKLLVTTLEGELILLKVNADECTIISRLQLSDQDEVMAHPVLVGRQLILRIGRKLCCLKL